MPSEIAPSILSANFGKLDNDISQCLDNGIKYLHVDVMDGSFVPNITIGSAFAKVVANHKPRCIVDTHLMIVKPERHLEDFITAGSDIITVHYEACTHLDRTLFFIKEKGCKAGVAINPSTPVSVLECVLDKVDLVLVMSVNPGFGGQKIITSCIEKVFQLEQIREEKKLSYLIEIDGGVKKDNIAEISKKGADIIVAGSAVFSFGNISENLNSLQTALKEQ